MELAISSHAPLSPPLCTHTHAPLPTSPAVRMHTSASPHLHVLHGLGGIGASMALAASVQAWPWRHRPRPWAVVPHTSASPQPPTGACLRTGWWDPGLVLNMLARKPLRAAARAAQGCYCPGLVLAGGGQGSLRAVLSREVLSRDGRPRQALPARVALAVSLLLGAARGRVPGEREHRRRLKHEGEAAGKLLGH